MCGVVVVRALFVDKKNKFCDRSILSFKKNVVARFVIYREYVHLCGTNLLGIELMTFIHETYHFPILPMIPNHERLLSDFTHK